MICKDLLSSEFDIIHFNITLSLVVHLLYTHQVYHILYTHQVYAHTCTIHRGLCTYCTHTRFMHTLYTGVYAHTVHTPGLCTYCTHTRFMHLLYTHQVYAHTIHQVYAHTVHTPGLCTYCTHAIHRGLYTYYTHTIQRSIEPHRHTTR